MPDDELSALFPNISQYLRDNTPPSAQNDPLVQADEHSGITMEAVDAFMRNQNRPGAMFRSGQGAPAPKGGWEDGPQANAPVTPGQLSGEQQQPTPPNNPQPPEEDGHQDTGERQVPSTPPGQSNDPSETPRPTPAEMPQPFQTNPDDAGQTPPKPNETPSSQTPPSTSQAPDGEPYVQLGEYRVPYSQLVALQKYYEQQQGQAAAPTSTPQPTDPYAAILEEYGDDPTVTALVQTVRAQQEQLAADVARTNQLLQAQFEQESQRRYQEFQAAATEGISNFQRRYSLTDEQVEAIRQEAARLNVVNNLVPTLGPVGAVEKALETAYFMNEEYRAAAIQQAAEEQRKQSTKKQKLAAISGSSGSVPRTTPAPTTEEGRRDAMINDVAAMMNGTWTGDNN